MLINPVECFLILANDADKYYTRFLESTVKMNMYQLEERQNSTNKIKNMILTGVDETWEKLRKQ